MSASTATKPTGRGIKAGHVEAWTGGWRRYDLVKEFVIAFVVVSLLTVALAVVFSSPDDQPVTIARWAGANPKDFLTAAVSELNRSSEVAGSGPPYTNTSDAAQKIGPLCLACVPGVHIPVNTASQFILGPLTEQAPSDPALTRALTQYTSASPSQQTAWTDASTKALDQVTFTNGQPTLPPGDYGPVPAMLSALLLQARSGGLDGALLATSQFYQTDYTKPQGNRGCGCTPSGTRSSRSPPPATPMP